MAYRETHPRDDGDRSLRFCQIHHRPLARSTSTAYLADFKGLLESVFDFKTIDQVDNRYLLEVGEGGNGAQVVLVEDTTSPQAQQGDGEVHHVAFRLAHHDSASVFKLSFKIVPSDLYSVNTTPSSDF